MEICLIIFFSFGKHLKERHYAQTFISSCWEHAETESDQIEEASALDST